MFIRFLNITRIHKQIYSKFSIHFIKFFVLNKFVVCSFDFDLGIKSINKQMYYKFSIHFIIALFFIIIKFYIIILLLKVYIICYFVVQDQLLDFIHNISGLCISKLLYYNVYILNTFFVYIRCFCL